MWYPTLVGDNLAGFRDKSQVASDIRICSKSGKQLVLWYSEIPCLYNFIIATKVFSIQFLLKWLSFVS